MNEEFKMDENQNSDSNKESIQNIDSDKETTINLDIDRYSEDDLKGILKAEYESSQRTRIILIVLVTASCICLACLWNSLQASWKHKRLDSLQKYIICLKNDIKSDKDLENKKIALIKLNSKVFNKEFKVYSDTTKNKYYQNKYLDSLKKNYSDSLVELLNKVVIKNNNNNFERTFFNNYFGGKALDIDKLETMYMFYWLITAEHIKSFKIPLFNISFDINDLGFISGLGFLIVLLLLYLSLTRERENVRIAFKASYYIYKETHISKRKNFYYMLSMNQLLSMPHVINKRNKRWLQHLPVLLISLPSIFSLLILINDISTIDIGQKIADSEAFLNFELVASAVFLVLIIVITIASVIEFENIQSLWKDEKNTLNRLTEINVKGLNVK